MSITTSMLSKCPGHFAGPAQRFCCTTGFLIFPRQASTKFRGTIHTFPITKEYQEVMFQPKDGEIESLAR